jgi:transcriptional regulator of acetoin/glycerol metabolism
MSPETLSQSHTHTHTHTHTARTARAQVKMATLIQSADAQTLTKKLQSSWSSWTVTQSLGDAQFVDDVRSNFDKLETKIKLKVLIALVALEPAKKSSCAAEIKRLLKVASEDTSDEVEISMYGILDYC